MPNPTVDITFKVTPTFAEVARKFQSVDIYGPIQKSIEEFSFMTEREAKIASPIDTGRLRSSIMTSIGNLQARVAAHVHYAIFVHEGTRYMKARPFMEIGLAKSKVTYFGSANQLVIHLKKELDYKLS